MIPSRPGRITTPTSTGAPSSAAWTTGTWSPKSDCWASESAPRVRKVHDCGPRATPSTDTTPVSETVMSASAGSSAPGVHTSRSESALSVAVPGAWSRRC